MTAVLELQELAQQVSTFEEGNSLTITQNGCLFSRLINSSKSFASPELAADGLKGYLVFLKALAAEKPETNLIQVTQDRLEIQGGKVTRPSAHGYWANKAYHKDQLVGDGYLSFRVPFQKSTIGVGFNESLDPNASYMYSDHHFRISSSRIRTYNGSKMTADELTMKEGDIFEIERINGTLSYYIADKLVYVNPVPVHGDLYAHVAFNGSSLSVEDIEVHSQPKVREQGTTDV